MSVKSLPWQIDHTMLCLYEEYRFDRRPEIVLVMKAREDLRDLKEAEDPAPYILAFQRALAAARDTFVSDRALETCKTEMSWIDGILKMMGSFPSEDEKDGEV